MNSFLKQAKPIFLSGVLGIFIYLMLSTIFPYLSWQTNIGFLRFKQQYIHIPVWKIAFYIHVFSAVFCLMAGLTQFSNEVLTKQPKVHRVIGRIYAWNILVINFPTGMVLAVTALGPLISKLGFVTLDCLWWWFTYKAVVTIKQHKVLLHKQFMMRSYALTLSAITLRTWNVLCNKVFHFDPIITYTISAWVGFVPNLLVAEWLIRTQKRKKKKLATPAKPIVQAISKPAITK